METETESAPEWARAPLPWQLDHWQRLDPLVHADRLPHALLVAGPAGIGKEHFLQALVSLLLCGQPATGTACGACRTCILLAAGSHADLFAVAPEDDSRVIKIDQVRALIEFAAKTPTLGQRKLILLGPAEAMNINAANALLKCLEEPSASTTLLLYSHQVSGLPATVRSRCQTLAMATPPRQDSERWLDQVTGSRETSAQLLDVSADRPLRARDIFYSDALENRLAIQRGLEALAQGELSALAFPELVKDMDLPRVLELMQLSLEGFLRNHATRAGGRQVRLGFTLRDEMAHLQRAIANGANPNRQLTLEDCAARLSQAVGENAGKC